MRRFKGELLGWCMAGMLLSGCHANPMGASGATSFTPITEVAVFGSAVYCTNTSTVNMNAPFGSPISYSYGNDSHSYIGPSIFGNRGGTLSTTPGSGPALVVGPFSDLCPSGTCTDAPRYRGVGGLNGDFSADYFLRWKGVKGPSASADYSSIQFNWGIERSLSGFQGVVFWARGHGNFAVNLMGNMGAGAPYSGYNFYLRRFGNELNGDSEWKEIVVYFNQMQQEYGLAADLPTVLSHTTGLQFDQQSPYTANFQLDLDYVRFF